MHQADDSNETSLIHRLNICANCSGLETRILNPDLPHQCRTDEGYQAANKILLLPLHAVQSQIELLKNDSLDSSNAFGILSRQVNGEMSEQEKPCCC